MNLLSNEGEADKCASFAQKQTIAGENRTCGFEGGYYVFS